MAAEHGVRAQRELKSVKFSLVRISDEESSVVISIASASVGVVAESPEVVSAK